MAFWDNVTGGATLAPPARTEAPVYQAPPVYQTPVQGYQPQQFQPQPPNPEAENEERHRRKAPSSRSNLTCPNCFGTNVCKPSANVMEQCYECGWNPRFEQQTGGIPTPGEATHTARQPSTQNNFNPQTIIGTVTV